MSNLDPTTQLSIAELAIYFILVPIIVYILVRHGKLGSHGWGFLIVFCGLRLASDGIQIGNRKNAANGGSAGSSGAIINSIGLSGLLYSLAGVIHECYHYVPNHNRTISFITQIVLHLTISTGIALSAIGGSNLAKPESAKNNHSTDQALRRVGALMLLLSALLLILYASNAYRCLRDISSRRLNRLVMRLLAGAVLALPFTATRAVYSVVYSFDASPSVNPITGVFTVKLVLIFLVQLLATLCLVVGGAMTRNIRIEDESALSSSPANVRATSGEPRRRGARQEYAMHRRGFAQEQHGKGLGSVFPRGG